MHVIEIPGEEREDSTQDIFELVIAKNFLKIRDRDQNTDPASSDFQCLNIPCSKCRKPKMKRNSSKKLERERETLPSVDS